MPQYHRAAIADGRRGTGIGGDAAVVALRVRHRHPRVQQGSSTSRATEHTPASQKAVQLTGRALACQRADGEGERYRLAVSFGDDGQGGACADPKLGTSMAEAMNALLTDVTAWRQRELRSKGIHLRGELSQVRLPSLLSFLSLERTSGVLELSRGAAHAELFVREGQIVDVEMGSFTPCA